MFKNVLSLFDGIAAARVALDRANIPVKSYFASEIDSSAIAVAKANWPDITHVGDIRGLVGEGMSVDLLIGGSPCQDLSIERGRNRAGVEGNKSSLFFEYVRLLRETTPKYFVLENVNSMSKKDRAIITRELGVDPVMLDAALVSAQRRRRLFWVGVWNGQKYVSANIPEPQDKGIRIWDILEDNPPIEYYTLRQSKRDLVLGDEPFQVIREERTPEGKRIRRQYTAELGRDYMPRNGQTKAYYGRPVDKANCLLTSPSLNNAIVQLGVPRMTTPTEWERLMGIPDGYTSMVSTVERYKLIGNSFHVDIVAHILRNILNRGL